MNQKTHPILLGCIALLFLSFFLPMSYNILFGNHAGHKATNAIGSAEITSVSVAPFVTSQGKQAQIINVGFRNTGTVPIYGLNASLTVYNAAGQVIGTVPLSPVYGNARGIAPGDTFAESGDEGWVWMPDFQGVATKATAQVVKIDTEFKTF
jgi:hypothetical protein